MKKTILLFLITFYNLQAIGQWEHQEPLHGKIVQTRVTTL
jgi:hypothetical protein